MPQDRPPAYNPMVYNAGVESSGPTKMPDQGVMQIGAPYYY